MKKTLKLAIVATASFLLVASSAYAMPILGGSSIDGFTWEASDSEGRSAEAVFSYDAGAGEVTIQLTNTTSSLVSVPNQGLAGLFFDFDGLLIDPHVDLGGSYLYVAPGDLPRADGGDSTVDGNLDGEFGFLADINGINDNLGYYGISNTAFDPELGAPLGWVGFGGTIIDETVAYPQYNTPNGPGFLIVGAPGAAEPMASFSYIRNEVFITFSYTGDFDASSIGQVNFLYGTDYGTSVNEPATMLLFGTGLVGLAGFRRRKRK